MFSQCYPNTLKTTTELLFDSTSYVITGDIPLMWMRDSSAQVHQYLHLAKSDPQMQIVIEGLIRRQILWIGMDVYGASYRLILDFDHAVRGNVFRGLP
jgi:meiotically up-regulated gene 157 (Mug157) protein